MIPDKLFKKALQHSYKEYKCHSDGQEVEKGYKPDFVLRNGNEYIILESENTSSRKTFVGGMVKAAHFLRNDKSGILIFVIVPKKNTRAQSIVNHLKPYFNWIKDKTNLGEIYVIEAKHYFKNGNCIALDSINFKDVALKI